MSNRGLSSRGEPFSILIYERQKNMTTFQSSIDDVDVAIEDRIAEGLLVIDHALTLGASEILPLFSGGHDSLSACYLASMHPAFDGRVYHIDTGIGSNITRCFVEDVCKEYGWQLCVYKSNFSYEKFVERLGFPGPGAHQWVYNKLKDRPISQMTKGRGRVVLITGCRQQESLRRMGHVEPVKLGETSKKTGNVSRKNRIWTAPCWNWSVQDQKEFMEFFGLSRNPLKCCPLKMSGECFCGAFARPGEYNMIRVYAPDVADEIDRLTEVAKRAGTHSQWGTPKVREKMLTSVQTGPLCHSCDAKLAARGMVFEEIDRHAR